MSFFTFFIISFIFDLIIICVGNKSWAWFKYSKMCSSWSFANLSVTCFLNKLQIYMNVLENFFSSSQYDWMVLADLCLSVFLSVSNCTNLQTPLLSTCMLFHNNPSVLTFQVTMAMTGQTSCSSMSNHTKERVTMAKVTLENFYSNLISQHEEREMRWDAPVRSRADGGDEQKSLNH